MPFLSTPRAMPAAFCFAGGSGWNIVPPMKRLCLVAAVALAGGLAGFAQPAGTKLWEFNIGDSVFFLPGHWRGRDDLPRLRERKTLRDPSQRSKAVGVSRRVWFLLLAGRGGRWYDLLRLG